MVDNSDPKFYDYVVEHVSGEEKNEPFPVPSQQSETNLWSSVQSALQTLPQISPNLDKSSWMGRMQEALSLEDSVARRAVFMETFLSFQECAVASSLTILAELTKSDVERTIHSQKLGGIAGGSKFVNNGILFKVATDPELRPNLHLYGGNCPNLGRANKAASNELKGCNAYFRFFYDNHLPVYQPFQLLIDWGGFRLVAMPLVPIGPGSRLVYGSSDGGRTVHADDPLLNQIMQLAGMELHLAGHQVGKCQLWAAGDVEAHVGLDGRFWLLDLARTFPPENPPPHLPRVNSSVFYRLLRPEFLGHLKCLKLQPLSSDALTGWGSGYEDSRMHAQRVVGATQFLLSDNGPLGQLTRSLISRYAEDHLDLDRVKRAFLEFNPSLEKAIEKGKWQTKQGVIDGVRFWTKVQLDLTYEWTVGPSPQLLDCPQWMRKKFNVLDEEEEEGGLKISQEFHRFGMPLRHLGLVRQKVRKEDAKQPDPLSRRLLLELVMRSLKNQFREYFRGKIGGSVKNQVGSQVPDEAALAFLNSVVRSTRNSLCESQSSQQSEPSVPSLVSSSSPSSSCFSSASCSSCSSSCSGSVSASCSSSCASNATADSTPYNNYSAYEQYSSPTDKYNSPAYSSSELEASEASEGWEDSGEGDPWGHALVKDIQARFGDLALQEEESRDPQYLLSLFRGEHARIVAYLCRTTGVSLGPHTLTERKKGHVSLHQTSGSRTNNAFRSLTVEKVGVRVKTMPFLDGVRAQWLTDKALKSERDVPAFVAHVSQATAVVRMALASYPLDESLNKLLYACECCQVLAQDPEAKQLRDPNSPALRQQLVSVYEEFLAFERDAKEPPPPHAVYCHELLAMMCRIRARDTALPGSLGGVYPASCSPGILGSSATSPANSTTNSNTSTNSNNGDHFASNNHADNNTSTHMTSTTTNIAGAVMTTEGGPGFVQSNFPAYELSYAPSMLAIAATLSDDPALARFLIAHSGHCEQGLAPSPALERFLNRATDLPLRSTVKALPTALMLACEGNHLQFAKVLIEFKAQAWPPEPYRSPLSLAAEQGHLAVVEHLLAGENRTTLAARINQRETAGRTALMLTVNRGHYQVAKLLLEHGGDVLAFDRGGSSCLHYAATEGFFDLACLILACCAGASALDWEVSGDLTLELIAAASARLRSSGNQKAMIAQVNSADRKGITPLHWACKNGRWTVALLLLSLGARSRRIALDFALARHEADMRTQSAENPFYSLVVSTLEERHCLVQ